MKNLNFFILSAASAVIMIVAGLNLTSCSDDEASITNPFDIINESANDARDKILVISDLHLGQTLEYSETVAHLPQLEQFLNEVRSSATIKEVIIDGDMFDEWYIPGWIDTYAGGTQADLMKNTVKANQSIFDIFNGIIKDGKIKLTYIPGNHDMAITAENVELVMPGINQARDAGAKFGVGTYHPDGYPQIAIEHSHRYDFFNAITPNANETEAKGATTPPGYFFARIAANSFLDPTTQEAATKVPTVTLNDPSNAEQYSKYVYYSLWKNVMESLIYVKDDFDDPVIVTNIGNYTKTYAINDVLPHNDTDGNIQINLYNGSFTQANWDEREKYNNVTVMTNINEAIVGSLKTAFIDEAANLQYFQNSLSDVRIVVFGHTHIPMIKMHTNLKGESCIYANSGTWVDKKTRDKSEEINQDAINKHFVMIYPTKTDANKLQVDLYQFINGGHSLVTSQEVEF